MGQEFGAGAIAEHVVIGPQCAELVALGGESSDDLDQFFVVGVVRGGGKAGQVCTSVQRLYVHNAVADDLFEALRKELGTRVVGDPSDAATDIGPLISEESAVRVQAWLDEAVAQGATIAYGGGREGRVLRPAIVANASLDMKLMSQVLFGPLSRHERHAGTIGCQTATSVSWFRQGT